VCINTPGFGFLEATAIGNASHTGQHVRCHGPPHDLAEEQVDDHREIRPAWAVWLSVMSPAQAWLGCAGMNSRLSTLSATGRLCLLSVMWTNLRRQQALLGFVSQSRAE